MTKSNASLYQIALTYIPQVGAITARNLIAYCGGVEEVFRAKKTDLIKIPGIGPGIVEAIGTKDALSKAEVELDFIEKQGVHALFFTHPDFPERLRSRRDSPLMVFFKGSDVRLLDAKRMVAIVGTRDVSEHGRDICEEIVEGLLPYDVVVVSGLAYGVDITAHRRASQVGIPNIGVLGHGLGTIYPATHRSTAQRMMEHGGLLTEYTHAVGPDREHFPMRNRIISGLCDALLVVESGTSGGSMISVEFATKHYLEVFAVPGRAKDAKSAGCNQLIKNNRARLTESADDIAEAMNWAKGGSAKATQAQLFTELNEEEIRIVDIVKQKPSVDIDSLSEAAGLPTGTLANFLLQLEFKGVIKSKPGKRYVIA